MGYTILTGPLLSGHADDIVADLGELVQLDVADFAHERVAYLLDVHIKHPTPYYETQIVRQRLGTDQVVHDRGVVYGPWLEGTSTRNKTTRFKGYHSFRRALQETEHRAQAIADLTIARHLYRLGG